MAQGFSGDPSFRLFFFRGSTPSPNAKALRGAITPDIRLWREHDRGGHFPMLEETETLAADITAFADFVS
jgi:epoxide hydrolase